MFLRQPASNVRSQETLIFSFSQPGLLFARDRVHVCLVPLGPLFGRNGALWEVRGIDISRRDRRGTLISIPFLGLRKFWRGPKKTSKCEHSKPIYIYIYISRSGSTKNACCLIHLVSRICFSPEEQCTSQKCVFSRDFGLLIFALCFVCHLPHGR